MHQPIILFFECPRGALCSRILESSFDGLSLSGLNSYEGRRSRYDARPRLFAWSYHDNLPFHSNIDAVIMPQKVEDVLSLGRFRVNNLARSARDKKTGTISRMKLGLSRFSPERWIGTCNCFWESSIGFGENLQTLENFGTGLKNMFFQLFGRLDFSCERSESSCFKNFENLLL